MRIRLFLGADPDKTKVAENLFGLLKQEFDPDPDIVLTDDNPDAIHFIGAWTSVSVRIANDALGKYIAIIHTPLGALCPWQKPSPSHIRLTSKCNSIIASGQMEQELLDDGNKHNISLILNSVVTADTTTGKMASQYKGIYSNIIKESDDKLWHDVENKMSLIKEDDNIILNICKNLLYAQYLVQRRNIPHIFLNQLAELLTKSDYDEDRMGEVLKLIHLYTFTQHLEFVMQEASKLTEGYMPIPMKQDKTTEEMLKMITDY